MIDPLIFIRSVHFAATLLAGGTIAFMVLVAEPALRVASPRDFPALCRRLNLTIWAALAVAILSGIGWLVWLASDILGASIVEVCTQGGAWQVAADTRFGQVGSTRLVLALALGFFILKPEARQLQLGVAAVLVALLALVGHAGATPGLAGRLHLASDMMHLLAAGAWLGALPALAMLLAQTRRSRKPAWRKFTAAAVDRFSTIGFIAVAALLASGVLNSWNLLSGPRDLVATDYGRLVLLKIGLFAATVGIAAVNKYHLTPKIAARRRAPAAMRAMQRNSLAETGLGLCVLLFVGALGTLPPTAHVHTSSAEIPPDAAYVHIHDTQAMADVTINPGHAGHSTVTIRVMHEDSTELAPKVVRFALDPPSANLKSVERAAQRMVDGIWQADDIEIPQAGIWTVRVTVTPSAGPPIVLDAPIVIER